MALLFMDGFEANDAVNSSFASKWNAGSSSSVTSPVRFAFTGSRASPGNLIKTIPATSQLTIGFAFSDNGASGGGEFNCVQLYSNAGATQQLYITYKGSDGHFRVYRTGGTLLATGTGSVTQGAGNWGYVEFQCTIAASGGIAVAHLNGSADSSFTGQTQATSPYTTIDTVEFVNAFVFDDVYMADGTGTVNNGFLGDVRVIPVVPDGPGAHTQFTPSTGANWSCVDALPIQSVTSVSAASGSGDVDSYAISGLGYTPATVCGVQTSTSLAQSGGTVTGKTMLRAGGTDYPGASQSVTQAGQLWFGDMWNTNPNSAAAWAAPDLTSLQIGVEVV